MHFRPLRSLSALTFASALFLGLAPSSSAAGAKDKEAEKLFKSAIDEDYLNADFPKAEKKLKDAVAKCGSACSDELLGKIHIALGTVYGVGLSKPDDAKREFTAALKADAKAALDPSLTTPDLTKIFEEAKKGAGGGGSSTPTPTPTPKTPSGEGSHTPPAESQVNTPLPLYVEPSDEVPLSKVTLRYKPFGATQYKSAEMRKVGKGFGVEVPCEDVTTTGDVKYYFAFTGADGEAAGGLGSTKEPFKTTIKNELEGDAPKLPGKKAPEQCKEKGDCPPGLPGCEPVKGGGGGVKHGDKGWGSSCDQPVDCKEGLTCLNGTCEEDKGGGGGGDKPDEGKKRMNLIGLGVQFDVLSLSGTSAACDGSNPAYACFVQGTNTQYYGGPIPFKNTDGIQGGAGFAGARILVGYDRQLVKKIGLSLGVRLGYAFGGPGSPTNTPPNSVTGLKPDGTVGTIGTPQAQAKGFLPFHGELRLSYSLLGSMMENKKFRPYVFIDGGLAQVNAAVPVALCDLNITPTDSGKGCGVPGKTTILRSVDAYQITGLNFLGFGGGTTFGITPLFGLAVELKFMLMVPTFGFVFSPNIGPVFNF